MLWNAHNYPDRKRYRLPGHDYRKPSRYFVTICTHERQRIFGKIHDGKMHLNDFGRIADTHWKSLPDHFPHVRLDNHVVMPDHIHGIIDIVDGGYSAERRPRSDGQNPAGPRFTAAGNDTEPDDPERPRFTAAGNDPEPRLTHTDSPETQDTPRPGPPRPETGSLGMIIGAYKSGVTREINRLRSSPGAAVWQYRYHERIIRTDASHERIRRYIENNPVRWTIDHPHG